MSRLRLNAQDGRMSAGTPTNSRQTPPARGLGRHAAFSLFGRRAVNQRTRGFTLGEIIIAMTVTSIVSMVVSGLVVAVHKAWEHNKGLEDVGNQARATIDRMQYMIAHAGVYKVAGQPTTLGLAVVSRRWAILDFPDVLVVWSGGRFGGMSDAGILQRLPRMDELVIYAPDPGDPSRLLEITLPEDSRVIDFRDPNFGRSIQSAIQSPDAESALLCDRVRRTRLPRLAGASQRFELANVRYELVLTPSDGELTGTSPGTKAWSELPWSQGIVSSDSGLRQATVRMELQVEPQEGQSSWIPSKSVAIPFFTSASYRYVFQP